MVEICRRTGISQATYFNWKRKHEGPLPAEMRRLKQFEDENAKLRKLVADYETRGYSIARMVRGSYVRQQCNLG